MQKQLHDFLLSVDEKDNWEFPQNSKYDVTFVEVESLKVELESIVGKKLDIDNNLQDASFMTDVGILDEKHYDRKTGTGAIIHLFAIRFSNFGRMFTVHGSEFLSHKVEYNLEKAIIFLERKNFKYIPAEELDVPYDGINKHHGYDGLTWWVRYFDYI